MNATTTLTIRLSTELKEKIGRLSAATRRSQSYIAVDALEAQINRKLEIIEGIQQGLEDMRAGRVVPHDEAMDQIDAIIAAARSRKA